MRSIREDTAAKTDPSIKQPDTIPGGWNRTTFIGGIFTTNALLSRFLLTSFDIWKHPDQEQSLAPGERDVIRD
ncbi:hypothetical protein J6590_046094 [Homalodisca vitripennis]|nr:hypothetical protein J6590_046094 [Homalodisca vitripennis]